MIQLRPPICCTFELQARRITFASFYGAADDVETRGWLELGWRVVENENIGVSMYAGDRTSGAFHDILRRGGAAVSY